MVSDEEISLALLTLLQKAHPDPGSDSNYASLDGVVGQLESKFGVDLGHKVDFIRTQIHQFLKSPPPKDDFALQQSPNFQSSASSSSTTFQSAFSVQQGNVDDAVAGNAVVPAPDAARESTQAKGKRRPGGLNKLCGVSPELQAIVGQPALPRTEIVKQLWAYIRKTNLQDPKNKRKIICNDELRLVFETDSTDMFKMNKLLAKHITPLEQTKDSVPKKAKLDSEPGIQSTESESSVIISEALANLFGVGGREMLQSEVINRIWEYIKRNSLEDPANPTIILCDAKLQELFGCMSISAWGIPQVLAQHYTFPRS